ncbi:hypothetical protein ATEIFO6365_0010036600 [Aspergillus terreus]|uniref:Uncharacterized protein n=1 Tax=Aspergillus terreus TaxID=33178 RepID=A0A5M3Z9W1_ASPTE|nr:hypothetical protein ATETN484_0012034500 [Aspergillus terreus]GFF19593.1 hypothetical protein ATEIFO6365_0010036600 [Aspergillus terreus]
MSNLQKFWLVFGPFNVPFQNELAYCYQCLFAGPMAYTDNVVSVDESVHCRLLLESDEEPGPDFFDKMSKTTTELLTAYAKAIEKGEADESSLLFLLPRNYYEQNS